MYVVTEVIVTIDGWCSRGQFVQQYVGVGLKDVMLNADKLMEWALTGKYLIVTAPLHCGP